MAAGVILVTRATVFAVAAAASTAPTALACEQLMVAGQAFGAGMGSLGNRARLPWRHLGTQPPVVAPTAIGQALLGAAQVLFSTGAVAAYTSLLPAAPNYIKYFGRSFFTKYLYFLGYGQPHPGPEPLILDQFVAKGLNSLMGAAGPFIPWAIPLPARGPWSPAQYGAYLAWAAAEVAAGPLTSAQQVEYRIWLHGKT